MHPAVRIGGFAAVLAAVFGLAWVAGAASRPAQAVALPSAPAAASPAAPAPGLRPSAGGYTLVPHVTSLDAGQPREIAFTIAGPAGPVTALDDGPSMSVLRADASGLQELRPQAGPDGVWRAPLALPAPGPYRAYVTFTPVGGSELSLAAHLLAPGPYVPTEFPPSRVAQAGDYQVRLDGELRPGRASPVFATVSRGGAAVTDLEPHADAFGRLVVVRRGDLALVPARADAPTPTATVRSGPGIAFTVEVPDGGGYRLFLEFRHEGVVRSVEFTVATPGA